MVKKLTAPWEKKLASMAVETAFLKSESSKMMRGDFPPSSSVTFVRSSEQADIIWECTNVIITACEKEGSGSTTHYICQLGMVFIATQMQP